MIKSGQSSGLRKYLLHFLDRCLLAPVKDMSLSKLNHLRIIESLGCCEVKVPGRLGKLLIVNERLTGIR
jgi:hypothetical protein